MTRFDPELIAALAEGRIEAAEAEVLERRIAADPQSAEALVAQRVALAILGAAEPVSLTAAERIRIRSSVADAIAIADTAPAEPRSVAGRRVRWPAIAVAAASLFAIVAIVPGIRLLTTGGEETSDETFAVAGEAPESEAQLRESDEAVPPQAQLLPAEEGDGSPTEQAAPTTTPQTTMAALTDDPAAAEGGLDAELKRIVDGAALEADPEATDCEFEARSMLGGQADTSIAATMLALESGDEAIIWFSPSGGTIQIAAIFSPDDCSLLSFFER